MTARDVLTGHTSRVKVPIWASVASLLLMAVAPPALPALAATLPDGSWAVPFMLETNNNTDARAPTVAAGPNGSAIAVWYETSASSSPIWASRFSIDSGWGSAQAIQSNTSGRAYDPRVAMDSSGNAMAVWRQFSGFVYDIWANSYRVDAGWGTAELIEHDDAGSALGADVAFDGTGVATALWYQSDGFVDSIWSNRFTPSMGWETAVPIETQNESAQNPHVAADAMGNAVVVWDQPNINSTHIWANRYVVGVGWGTETLLEQNTANRASLPRVAVNSSGYAWAAWTQGDGSTSRIWVCQFAPSSGWGNATIIDAGTGSAASPAIGVDESGNALVTWMQFGISVTDIWANRYVEGVGWGTAELIETQDSGFAYYPELAVDAPGSGVAVWQQSDGVRFSIWANRYNRDSGWETASLVEEVDLGDAQAARVAMDAGGNAVAVWEQTDSYHFSAWASRYYLGGAPDTTPPPLNLTEPLEGAWTPVAAVRVSGTTEANATVSVNGVLAQVSPNGSFSVVLALLSGQNRIAVRSLDGSGNTAEATVNVTFDDPLPGLILQVSSANLNLSILRDRLNETTLDLDASLAELARAQDDIATLQVRVSSLLANLLATRMDLADANDQLSLERVRVEDLEALLNATVGQLMETRAAVDSMEESLDRSNQDLQAVKRNNSEFEDRIGYLDQDLWQQRLELEATSANLSSAFASIEESQQRIEESDANASRAVDAAHTATTLAALGAIAGVLGVGIGLVGFFRGRGVGGRSGRKEGGERR